eukprot:TRINITY_DN23362_c0_g1_i1.p1 TRINITY_DN23362_c0_g1~~TRINITY_DN23362_c0_g1_i1.p1  ORF type:complete len:253 (+),score=24.16 TRINITY_DN23362_c0_g1_i1:50-760(+)
MAWALYVKVLCLASALDTFVCAFVLGMYCEHCFSDVSVFVIVPSISRTAALLSLVAVYRRSAHLVSGFAGSLQCCCSIWLLCSYGLYSILPVVIMSLAITFATWAFFVVKHRMRDIWNDDAEERDINLPADFVETGGRLTQMTLRHLVPGAHHYFDVVKGTKVSDAHSEFDIIGSGHCCVCLEQFSDGDEAMELLCNHLFHPKCLLRWRVSTYLLANSTVCPMRCGGIAEGQVVAV